MSLLGFIKFFGNEGQDFFSIGSVDLITMYALFLVGATVLGAFLAIKEAKKLGIAKSHIMDSLLICLPIAVVLARGFYVLFNLDTLVKEDGNKLQGFDIFTAVIDIQDGMLMPIALMVLIGFIIIFAKKTKLNAFKLFDIFVPTVLVIQVGAAIGNLFGGGRLSSVATTSEFLNTFMINFFVEKCGIDGTYFHPVFLYEGMWLSLGLILILIIRKMKFKLQVGDLIGFYLIWYAIGDLMFVEPFVELNVISLVLSILMLIGGVAFLVVKHIKFGQKSYFETQNEIYEKSLQCYVFDLDQTIIKSDNLVNAAYGETLTKNHGLTVYDDPQLALDSDRLRKYVQFTKEHHELLTEMYRGVKVTFDAIKQQRNEIIIISKLPADVIALKIHHYGLNKYVSRFINSNDIAKLGQQYNAHSIMVFSSDKKVLNYATRSGFKTAYAKFANEDTTGVVSDEVLNRFSDALYLV